MSNTQGGGSAGQSAGLYAALKNIVATLLTSGRTRLELLGNEIEEEKLRAIRLLVMALGMVFCLGMATLLAVILLALAFWENRLLLAGASTVFFLILGGYFFAEFKRAAEKPKNIFSTSLAELQEDIRLLKAAARNESNAD